MHNRRIKDARDAKKVLFRFEERLIKEGSQAGPPANGILKYVPLLYGQCFKSTSFGCFCLRNCFVFGVVNG